MTEEHPAVAYLRNAHARAEELARAATSGPWKAGEHTDYGFRVGAADGSAWVAWAGAYGDEPESSRPDSEFIAANDPTAMLARVATERQILDEHTNVNDGDCGTCVDGRWGYPTHGGSSPQRWPCRTVRLLAAGWGWTADIRG